MTIQSIRLNATSWQTYSLLLLGTFAGAWAAIFGRIAQHEGVPTPVMIAFRMIAGSLVLTPFVLHHYRDNIHKLTRRDLLRAAIAGVWFAIHLLTGFFALEHTSVLVSSVLGGTLPLWVAFLEVYVLRARLSRVVWIGLMITLSGGTIIALAGNQVTSGDNPALGSILAVIAAITGACYAIIGRDSRDRISFLPYLWLVFSFGAIVCLAVVFVAHQSFIGYSAQGYTALIMLAIFPQLIGHSIYNYVLRRIPATIASMAGQMGMLFSAVLAYFFFREIPGVWQLVGSAIIVAGIMLVNFGKVTHKQSAQAETQVV